MKYKHWIFSNYTVHTATVFIGIYFKRRAEKNKSSIYWVVTKCGGICLVFPMLRACSIFHYVVGNVCLCMGSKAFGFHG